VALYPEHAEDVDDVIEKVDKALYAAKNKGKNQICGCWEIPDNKG
jgi:GGDEF domain-containing protein